MTAETKAYQQYLEKLERTLLASERRRPLVLKGLADFMGNYATFAKMFATNAISKSHVIALKSSLTGLWNGETSLFSTSFQNAITLLGKAISEKVNSTPQAKEIIESWIFLTLFIPVGLLDLAKEPSKTDEPIDSLFKDELLLTLFFHTEYPRHLFRQMAEALEVESLNQPFFISSFETLALFTSISTLANTLESTPQIILESISKRLLTNIDRIEASIKEGGWNRQEQDSLFWSATLMRIRLALEKREFEEVIRIWIEFLEELGYSKEHFSSDLSQMKDLVKRFKTAYRESQENKTTHIHLVG